MEDDISREVTKDICRMLSTLVVADMLQMRDEKTYIAQVDVLVHSAYYCPLLFNTPIIFVNSV